MLKLLVFLSSIIVTGAFTLKLVNNPDTIVYSSQPSITANPTMIISQGQKLHTDTSPQVEVAGVSDELNIASATVIDVVRTDLIKVRQNNRIINVQLIGIDTPEDEQLRNYYIHHQEKTIDTIKTMLEGTTVFLVSDIKPGDIEVEPWQRYVFLKDMTFLNMELLHKGLAIYLPEENDRTQKYNKNFEEALQEAKDQQQGIWFTPTNTPTPTSTQIPTQIPTKKIGQPTVTQQKTITPPTQTPLQILTSTPKPTITTTPPPQPISFPTPTVTIPPHSLDPEKLFTMINEHRKSINLPSLQKHEYLCSIAQTRAPQLYDEIFLTKNVHAGFYAMNLPYWITENMAHYPSEEAIFNWWLGSTIHRQAIEGKHTYTCGACYGNSCVQLFTSFIPK